MKPLLTLALLPCLLVACSSTESGSAGAASAQMETAVPDAAVAPPADGNADTSDAGLAATLAYEHSAEVRIAAARIPERLQELRAACERARFGECVTLTVDEQGGDWPAATLVMRMQPQAIEPMLALAGEGAELGSRSTRAEDLAVAIRDNAQLRERLQREREQLLGFQQRSGLAVADMIALSRQIAEVEAQLQSAQQQSAQQQRRVNTQLLTLRLHPGAGRQGRSEVAQALRDVGATLSLGTAWTIRTIAFLLPLALPVGLLLWWWRRRRRRAR